MARVNDRAILAAISCWLAAGLVSTLPANADCPSGRLFLLASIYPIANRPTGLIARDINGDGIQDLVLSVDGDGGRITVRLGSGTGGVWDGSFQPDANYATGLQPGAIIMADFDGDGIQDLAISTADGILRILTGRGASGTGDGTFSDPISFPIAAYASHLAVGDFNHDGILDLAVLVQTPAKLLVLLGGGAGGVWDGTFGAPSTELLSPGSQPIQIIVSNFNGDGIADLAVLEFSNARVAVLIGSGSAGIGNGDFAAPVEYTVGTYNSSSARDLVAADVNSDGINDIIVSNYSAIEWFFGNGTGGVGDGTFTSGPSHAALNSGAIALDDLDLDGILDVAITGDGIVAVHRGGGVGGLGDGSFLVPTGYAVGDNSTDAVVADFNADGMLDLSTADSYSRQISILLAGCPPLPAPKTGVWADNGVPVCAAPGEQTDVRIVPDGAGGACLAWRDLRSGTNTDVYATRIDRDGLVVAGWVVDGSPVCTNPSAQGAVDLVPDGTGGAIVAWIDWRDGYQAIYAQRMLGDGNVAAGWPVDGLRVGTMSSQAGFEMDSDGAGGALFAWTDMRSGAYQQVFCLRLTGSGSLSPGWPAGGLAVRSASSISGLTIAADPSGGAFLAWRDYYSCSGHGCPPWTLYRYVAHARAGMVDWIRGGETSTNGAMYPQIVSDGVGGVIYAPNDGRSGYSRIDAAGNTLWGIASGSNPCTDFVPLISDGDEGCYAFWSCYGLEDVDGFATRITGDGSVAPGWTIDGHPIAPGPRFQWVAGGAADGLGGAFFAVLDSRSGLQNVYAVHVDANGASTWPPSGRIVCDQPGGQSFANLATSDPGSVIVGWVDGRNGPSDIYAQRISLQDVVAVTVSLVGASADPSAAYLVWQILERSPGRGFVQRRTDGEEWMEVGQCLADGVGRMRFEDRDVVAGQRYGYRLLIFDGGTPVQSDETWLTIPTEYALGLDRMRANPIVGDLDVAFVLPSGEAAMIELVDLAGRRIVARSVGELGAGRHVVLLASRGSLPPGIYFLRLLQAGTSVTSRICLLE